MKKVFLLLSVLLAGIFITATAEEILLEPMEESQPAAVPVLTAPKWEEFCEPGYEYVTAPAKNNLLNVVSVVKSEREKKTYWAGRRESFEKFLNHCKTIVDDNERGVCYTELRRLENDKNEVYNTKRKQILYLNDMIIKDSSK